MQGFFSKERSKSLILRRMNFILNIFTMVLQDNWGDCHCYLLPFKKKHTGESCDCVPQSQLKKNAIKETASFPFKRFCYKMQRKANAD